MIQKPKTLYHGTAIRHLDSILVNGLKPRYGRGVKANDPNFSSHVKAVYLTSAYPVRFAMDAVKKDKEDIVIFEVDVSLLNWNYMTPDDDVVTEMLAKDAGISFDKAIRRAQKSMMEFAGEANALESLRVGGSVAYFGTIPYQFITRYAVISWKEQFNFLVSLFDVSTSAIAFKLTGEVHRRKLAWIFDETPFVHPHFEGQDTSALPPEFEVFWKGVPDSRKGIDVVNLRVDSGE